MHEDLDGAEELTSATMVALPPVLSVRTTNTIIPMQRSMRVPRITLPHMHNRPCLVRSDTCDASACGLLILRSNGSCSCYTKERLYDARLPWMGHVLRAMRLPSRTWAFVQMKLFYRHGTHCVDDIDIEFKRDDALLQWAWY